MRTLSVAVCGLAVIEESLEPVLWVSFSRLFHMHHMRAAEMAHGELALFLYRWCYPFLSLSSTKKDREKEKTWSLLLAHLPAVYRTLIPTKRRIDPDLYSGLYICLFINSNQVVSFYPLISLVGTGDCVFSFPFHFLMGGSLYVSYRHTRTHIFDDWSQILHGKCQTDCHRVTIRFSIFLRISFFFPRTYKMLIYIQHLWYTLPSVPDRVRVMCVLNWLFLLILAVLVLCVFWFVYVFVS